MYGRLSSSMNGRFVDVMSIAGALAESAKRVIAK
jgi:hypothetical protein